MLALSSPLLSATYGWPMEDLFTQNLQEGWNDISTEVEPNSLADHFPSFDQIQNDFVPENSVSSGGAGSGGAGESMMVAKKLNHNASERDRRKRVNDLYAFLHSLLPMSSDQKKKVSIPGTICRALKYIPELQEEVERLICKKEKLLSSSLSTNIQKKDHIGLKKQSAKDAVIKAKPSVVSSVSVLGKNEAVVQLIASIDHMNKNKEIGFLSKTLELLEEDESGLVLLNATTFKSFGDERLFNTLHLQVQGDHEIGAEKLKEKLCSFY